MLLISSPLFPYAPPQNCNASPFLLLLLLFPSERSPSSSKAARAGGLRLSLIWRARPTVRGSDPGWASLPSETSHPRSSSERGLSSFFRAFDHPSAAAQTSGPSSSLSLDLSRVSLPSSSSAAFAVDGGDYSWERREGERERERCPSPSLLPHSVQMVPLGVLPLLRPNDQWE